MARSAPGQVLSVDFGGAVERLRVQLEPDWGVVSAIGREHRSGASSALPSEPQGVDVTRTSTEQARLAITRRPARDARHPPLSSAADPDRQLPTAEHRSRRPRRRCATRRCCASW